MRRIVIGGVVALVCIALVAQPTGTVVAGEPTEDDKASPSTIPAPGVTRKTIKIGFHAPITGAAPLPSDSIERGKDLYFRWRAFKGHEINRRRVEVVLKNDQHNPSTAVAVCKEMVEQDEVFMLIGISGVNQMQACARYAASVGVPYVSPGTTGLVLRQLDNYFATSMIWKRQARLLADYLLERHGARRKQNGMLWSDSPNHQAPHDRFVGVMTRRDGPLTYDRSVSQGAGTAEARTVVTEMDVAGIDNVFYLHSPVWFLNVLQQAETQEFYPLWTSIGPVIAYDFVVRPACDSRIDPRVKSLSPWPAFVDRDRFDARFDRASSHFYPAGPAPDDVMWQLWAQSRVLEKMLDKPGRRLTRQRFINRVERSTIRTGILPTLRYRPENHFGAAAVHLLSLSCVDESWHTTRAFVRDF